MWRGGLSYRRLWVLVRYLPVDSATQTALRDAELDGTAELVAPEPAAEERHGPWALSNYQLAQVIDAIRELTYVEAVAGGVTPVPKPPLPTPRPGLRRKPAPNDALAEAQVLYLNKIRARG